jgi:UDP-glucose 4-epimerase
MRVLITGGAGFLGRGILRRLSQTTSQSPFFASGVTVYSRDETKQDECRKRYPNVNYVLGDIRDIDRLAAVMVGHEVVIHAAALKYIPEAELNAGECVSVNIDGARSVIKAAKVADVETVIGVSTDKACLPVNIYGASKMVMERLFADEALMQMMGGPPPQREGGWTQVTPRFITVRYGNVIGSTGSVLPLFKEQYEQFGKVRITNPDMTRFWMSIDEAIDLIEMAYLHASHGAVVIPSTSAMTILDAAKASTIDDVEVEVIGTRPGEKAHEMLLHYEESVRVRPLRLAHGDMYYELLPPGISGDMDEAFTLASHTPHKRLSVVDMRRHLEDARGV